MASEEERQRLAALFAADQVRRAEAEIEIARKEARLAEEQAKLAAIEADIERLEGAIAEARQEQGEEQEAANDE